MRSKSITKRVLSILLPFGLIAFQTFVWFFATKHQLKVIGSYHLDKIPHVLGGIFLALVYELQVSRPRLWQLVLFIAAAAGVWESYEFFFTADAAYFYSRFPDLWRLDTAGDIVAAFLGGYGYWVFGRKRPR